MELISSLFLGTFLILYSILYPLFKRPVIATYGVILVIIMVLSYRLFNYLRQQTFNKKTDAILWGKTLEDKLKTVPIPDNNIDNLKLKDLLNRYSKEISPKLKGFEREVYKINLIIRSWLGEIPVINLNKHHINQYRDDRLKVVKSGTVRSDLMLIKRVIKTSISQWGYGLPNNPMDSVVMPSPHKPRSRRVSEEELELLLQNAKSNRNIFIAPIIEFAIETGMRRSEILKLKWENIDNGIASL